MREERTPNYGLRALLIILAVGAAGIVLAVASNNSGEFLAFNLNHMLWLGIILVIGGVLLLFGAFQNLSAGTIANAIIGIGVVAIIVPIVLGLGRLASDFLSFDLTQILILGFVFVVVGFLLKTWLNDSHNVIPRRIGWTLIVLGVIAIVVALVAGTNTPFGFVSSQLLAIGILMAIVGVILLLFYRGQLDAPTPAAMAQARVANMKAASSAPPAPPLTYTTQVAPPAPTPASTTPASSARSTVPSMDKKDDLTIIEGIGPKSADALFKAKIYTFSQLAELSPDELLRIVKVEGGVNLVNDPKTWPKQAQLLAEGKREEFEEYVKYLVSSRDPNGKK
ncbi:MAG: helix-hairpin-helix domain-containing protein [Anaerolineae bacterium]|nr:hypothetical protein [Candidatus Saccharibacteria bacterium]